MGKKNENSASASQVQLFNTSLPVEQGTRGEGKKKKRKRMFRKLGTGDLKKKFRFNEK